MWRPIPSLLLVLAFGLPAATPAQDEPNLDARQRLLPEIGAGFRAIRYHDGRYYVLLAPGKAVQVFDDGEKVAQIPAQPTGPAAIVFGAALDVDADGQVYVADRGGNAVKVYASDGTLAASIPVTEPTGVAALPNGAIAVASLSGNNLITVFDLHGKVLRSFGDRADLADSADLNRRLNLGYLLSDGSGNLYYAFEYVPEPTVRKYDSTGNLVSEFSVTSLDFQGIAQAARREIARANSGARGVTPHEIVSAIGVDTDSQEIWLALADLLLRVSPKGDVLSAMRTYTPTGTRIDSRYILVEPERLLLGADPLGIYVVLPRDRGKPIR